MMLWLMLVKVGGMRSLVKARELFDDVMVDAGGDWKMRSLVKARELYGVMVDAGGDWRDEEPCESYRAL